METPQTVPPQNPPEHHGKNVYLRIRTIVAEAGNHIQWLFKSRLGTILISLGLQVIATLSTGVRRTTCIVAGYLICLIGIRNSKPVAERGWPKTIALALSLGLIFAGIFFALGQLPQPPHIPSLTEIGTVVEQSMRTVLKTWPPQPSVPLKSDSPPVQAQAQKKTHTRTSSIPRDSDASQTSNAKEDVDLKRLHGAETLLQSLTGWHTAKIRDRMNREKRAAEENQARGLDPGTSAARIRWIDDNWWEETLRDYQETFAPELIRLRREMLATVPEAAQDTYGSSNWQNPMNSGDITGLYFEFRKTIAFYRRKLRDQGKLTEPLSEDELMRSFQQPKQQP